MTTRPAHRFESSVRRWSRLAALPAVVLAGVITSAANGQDRMPLVPESISPSSLVTQAISAEFLSETERAELRVRHGLWTDADLSLVPRGRAIAAAEEAIREDPGAAAAKVLGGRRKAGAEVHKAAKV